MASDTHALPQHVRCAITLVLGRVTRLEPSESTGFAGPSRILVSWELDSRRANPDVEIWISRVNPDAEIQYIQSNPDAEVPDGCRDPARPSSSESRDPDELS
jgi:hypothetical protein